MPEAKATTVLVVDDDPGILQLVQTILQMQGYKVVLANGGWNAVKVFETARESIELLLTDVVMPDLSGPVLAMRLQARNSGLRVLFMSGFHDTELVRRSLTAPAVSILPKPFTSEGLLRAVREALQ